MNINKYLTHSEVGKSSKDDKTSEQKFENLITHLHITQLHHLQVSLYPSFISKRRK